jgi:hypothetical protein
MREKSERIGTKKFVDRIIRLTRFFWEGIKGLAKERVWVIVNFRGATKLG